MALDNFNFPPLPNPPREYDPQYMRQVLRGLEIYFSQLDSNSPNNAQKYTADQFVGGTYTGKIYNFVDSLADLANLTYSGVAAGDKVYTKTEDRLLVVLAADATNAVFDYTPTGGVKLTYANGIVTSFSSPVKETAFTIAQAITMADDISTMKGYALTAGTTGGAGYATYIVLNASNNVDDANSLLWAVEQARTAGGGKVIFFPRDEFDVYLTEQILIPDNITIDAPGRNVRIWAPRDQTRFKVTGKNVIIRRLQFGATPDPATATLRDGIWIYPSTADKVWIDQCSFQLAGDGCIDMTTTLVLTADCRVTVSRCYFHIHDKGSLLGSLACYQPGVSAFTASISTTNMTVTATTTTPILVGQTIQTTSGTGVTSGTTVVSQTSGTTGGVGVYVVSISQTVASTTMTGGVPAYCSSALTNQTIRLFVTMQENFWHCVSQRQPKAVTQTFVDSVNNAIRMAPFQRDDGTTGACYGIFTATGGTARSRNDVFVSAYGTGYSGTNASTLNYAPPVGTTPTTEGLGAMAVSGSIAGDGITLTQQQTASVPTPPYTITPLPVVDTPAGRRAFVEAIQAGAGCAASNAPEGVFRWEVANTAYPNTITSVSETAGVGRWLRTDRWDIYPDYQSVGIPNEPVIYLRGPTLDIASGAITVPLNGVYFAIDTEGGAATDDLDTITASPDYRVIILRQGSSARDITIKDGTGNIKLAGGDYKMQTTTSRITFMYEAPYWYELSRSGGIANPPVVYTRGTTLGIASGAITPPEDGVYFAVDTQYLAATDDLDTINASTSDNYRMLILRQAQTGRDITVKTGTGNLRMASGDYAMTTTTNRITFLYEAPYWVELSRS